MTKFNSYFHKADEIAKAAFAEITTAENKLKETEATRRANPQRHGMVDASYAARAARAEADYQEARENMRTVQEKMALYSNQIADLRLKLATALSDEFAARPEAVDTATLTLLQSGILTSSEYARLMETAKRADNFTMMRIISRYASAAADEASEKFGQGDRLAVELRTIAHSGNATGADEILKAYDVVVDAFKRSMNNHAMIPRWGELTAPIINQF